MEEKDLVFIDERYGDHERHTFDLTIPAGYGDWHGLILFIHGGAWIAGSKDGYRDELEKWRARGYAAAAINYRYISEDVHMDGLLDDIGAAVAAIRKLALDHGVSLERMLLTGASAGGHLSLLYAYANADVSPIRPVGVIDYCGPAWLADDNLLYGTPEHYPPQEKWTELFSNVIGFPATKEEEARAKEALMKYSPVKYVTPDTVPTIICHGQKDDVVPFTNAVALRDALEKNGVEYVFLPMPLAGHPLEQREIMEESEALFEFYAKRFL